MKTSLAIAFTALLCCVMSQNSADDEDCYCVQYYLCRTEDKTIITDGLGIITDPRLGVITESRLKPKCNETEVCCKLANQTSTSTRNPKPTSRPPPNLEKCGFRSPKGVGYRGIANVQNNETEFGEFPWMVGILTSDGKYKCGGSLIHPSVVLTAAHCVVNKTTFLVRAGEWDSTSTNEAFQHQDRKVASKKIHEDYRPGIFYNDIALLFVETPFDLAQHIRLACLPPLNTVDDNSRCFVTGWGKLNFGKDGDLPPILKEIELPMVPKQTCQENLRKTRLGMFYQLHDSFVCAGGEEGIDSCIGDGGGPLVCPIADTEERYQQIGVVSWGIGCYEKDTPGVYANVAFLRDWIDKQMKNNNYDINLYQY